MAVNFSISSMPVRLIRDKEGKLFYNTDKSKVKFYAKAQAAGEMSFEEFAEHVASHNSKYHKGDVLAMIVEVNRCLHEELLNGKIISLSDLGTFSLVLSGPGAESVTDFNTTANIEKVKVRWKPGKLFKNLRQNDALQLKQVLTTKEDAEIKKAKKAASPSVKDESPSGSDSPSGDNVPGGTTTDNSQQTTDNPSGGNPSGGQQTTDNGQQSGGDDGLV
ncbi:MAG: hypothetical protein Q4E60_10245 [Bacteroidales bacterium]|nr:hypothetical protein [Bacteroidales bacterium]